jgi:hypothetical protein
VHVHIIPRRALAFKERGVGCLGKGGFVVGVTDNVVPGPVFLVTFVTLQDSETQSCRRPGIVWQGTAVKCIALVIQVSRLVK